MTIEQKAKAYDDAISRAKVVNKGTLDYNIVAEIFPELKESEDERIRAEIISALEMNVDTILSVLFPGAHYTVKEAIAWLEKQGEQKPADPNGEWIEDYWVYHKVNNPDSYNCGEEIQFDYEGFVRFCKQFQEPAKWSIEDERMLNNIYDVIDDYQVNNSYEKEISWLKSLRPQPHWKPSEEQLMYLAAAIEESGENPILDSLYKDLKRL